MTENLTKSLIDLRRSRFAAERNTELRLDHVERSLDIRPLVIVSQKFFAVQIVKMEHAIPQRRLGSIR